MSTLPESLATASGTLSDLGLERFLAGELDPEELAAVDKHLASHPPDAARVQAARDSDASFRARARPAWLDTPPSAAVGEEPVALAEVPPPSP